MIETHKCKYAEILSKFGIATARMLYDHDNITTSAIQRQGERNEQHFLSKGVDFELNSHETPLGCEIPITLLLS